MTAPTAGRLHTDGGSLIFDAVGDVVASTRTEPRYPEDAANARRLVACWNFCEALDIETMELWIAARAQT